MNLTEFKQWKKLDPSTEKSKRLLGKMVYDNEPLACKYAMRVVKSKVLDDDVKQCAMIGLMTAFRRYDPAKASFATWAWHWVRYEIQRHEQNTKPYMMPKGLILNARVMQRSVAIKAITGREATAEELGIKESVLMCSQLPGWLTSLDEVVNEASPGEGTDRTLHDYVEDVEADANYQLRLSECKELARCYVEELPEVERQLFTWVFVDKKPWEPRARALGIKKTQVMPLIHKWERELKALLYGWGES